MTLAPSRRNSRPCFTWRHEIGGGAVDVDTSGFAVPGQGNLVPSSIVDPPGRSFDFDGTRTQIQVQEHVTAQQLDSKVVALRGNATRRAMKGGK